MTAGSGHAPRYVVRGRAGYPEVLEHLSDSEPVDRLWVRGADPDVLGPRVAIVGARDATAYGLDVAHDLAADLAGMGVCIVSGLARGCDAAAHRGALSVGGATIAVLGTGVDRPYPARNRRLYDQIVERGCVVSEFALGTGPLRPNFTRRNRIIAALSAGVVLVQARDEKSGTKSTVDWAGTLGRTIFAVPGDVRSALSVFPHDLIRTGARLCTRAGDVIDELGRELGLAAPSGGQETLPFPPDLPPELHALLEAVSDGPAPADLLAARAGTSVAETLRGVTKLELRGLISRTASGIYKRR